MTWGKIQSLLISDFNFLSGKGTLNEYIRENFHVNDTSSRFSGLRCRW